MKSLSFFRLVWNCLITDPNTDWNDETWALYFYCFGGNKEELVRVLKEISSKY